MQRVIPDVFDDLEIGITLHDPETAEILGVNERLEDLYGYTAAELTEMDIADYSVESGGFTQQEAVARIRDAADGEPQMFEWHVERADGEQVWAKVKLAHTTLDGEAYVIAQIRDITERKERERALESERSFIEQSLDTLEDAFYMLDTEGNLQRWNATVAEVTGYTDEEIEEMHAMEFFGEDDQEKIADTIGEVLETGSSVVEADYVTKDGEHIPYEFTGTRLTDTDGQLRGIIGIGRDISDREERIRKLETQDRALRQIHETASTSAPFEEKIAELLEFGRAYMGVEQGFFTRIDDETQEIVVGVGPNEQLRAGAAAPFSESYCQYTLDSGGTLTLSNVDADGPVSEDAFDRFGLACYAGSVVELDGEAYGTICFADRDPHEKEFTDPQETFMELLATWASYELDRRERERKYRRLTDRISDAYYAVDTEFTVTYWNDVIAERQGVPAAEIVGENLWEQFPDLEESVVHEKFNEAMERQEPVTHEYHYESMGYWTKLDIYPDEDGLAIISRDITDRKAYEAKLEESNERLQQFAYVLSHDLQEPLRMVSSYVDILQAELADQLDGETQEYMDFVTDGADRMQEMIDALLRYSRVETRGGELEETDTASVVDDVLRDIQLMLEDADADVTVGDLPVVRADPQQVGQLFQNLLSNAVEHGGDATEIVISATETADGYEFTVSDDGPGIPEHQREDLFGLFEKGRDSEGTGIGLAICKRIVDRHDGEIRVESTEDSGTSFYFTLPRP